ncbi:hypothetical protein EYF80_026930 [Liparis tanakae]|uniref:Uncharacterized protein n=1 Tax=Liparis tanakae TaxID=230148 RepID=A0A4Z2HC51_9TELE|nr:hypothetical protein EYF80_026930 [Liparis tanakae]
MSVQGESGEEDKERGRSLKIFHVDQTLQNETWCIQGVSRRFLLMVSLNRGKSHLHQITKKNRNRPRPAQKKENQAAISHMVILTLLRGDVGNLSLWVDSDGHMKETPTQAEGGELLGLLSSNLCHVQFARLQVQVHQVGLYLVGQLDHAGHAALADRTYRRSFQQRDLVGVELHHHKVLLVRGQAD